MKTEENELNLIKSLFADDKEFIEAIEDASIIEKLNRPTKFSIYVEDIEDMLKKSLKKKNDLANKILFINYKRYLYKHIMELDKH